MMKYIIIPVIFFAAMFTHSACGKKESSVNRIKSINVSVKAAETRPMRPFIEAVGTLTPFDEVTISAEVDGIIDIMMVDEGTTVTRGMLIAAINDTDYLLGVTKAKAALRQAEANLSNMNLEYQRKNALFNEGHISRHDYDSVSVRQSLAESERDNAVAALSLAEHRLAKTKIFSPISGVVKVNMVSVGTFARNGEPVCSIIQVDPLKLSFTVPEKTSGVLRKGQDLRFKVETFNDREFNGRLNIIYPGLDEKTRTLMAEAVVSNPGRILKPGLFTTLKLFTGPAKSTLLVPAAALLYEGETIKVFTVKNETAYEQKVMTGTQYDDMLEIKKGLKTGDMVVTAGQQNLSEGVKVNVAR